MSQQYEPAPGPPPAPSTGGWGPAPGGGAAGPGGWGPGPGRPPQRPAKSNRTQWIIVGGAILAVALVAVGVVLLVTGGDGGEPTASQTPDPVGTLYTPSPTKAPNTKGPHDTGVEVGSGIWFTPAKGWLQGPDKTVGGKYYILQQFNKRGLIDGYYWVRQTELYDAKGFAEHLVDLESNGMKNVRIGKGVVCKPANEAIKACYAISYSGVWVSKSSGAQIPFKGFVTAYQDAWGKVTATDAGLEARVYQRRVNELTYMNNTLIKSF